ncbi:MAG: hypothetical protein KME07_18720 [Pegethrix bostrychoides GSE-TBD4-15B]|uniref:Uncharacterized protein n=1 Tax=Pegethrix bostrychoides GSE-TBD4-15B TaxID=2839662 RepID=A0A951PEA7_9CYAN|nr:hypothetical protein [Pegethrix bostrychoides GSE-TBD4-15B]
MSIIFFASLLLLLVWCTDFLMLWPIETLTTLHLSNWLSLTAAVLVFAWLAAE